MVSVTSVSTASSVYPQTSSTSSYASNPDRFIKLAQQTCYVEEVWWFLASVIAAMSLFHHSSLLLRMYYRHRKRPESTSDEKQHAETVVANNSGRISLRRISGAFACLFRNVMFRCTVPIGTHSVASLAELSFIVGYISAMLVWEFINSKDFETYLWEDRAAHLASCQIPLIVALASKNNIITLLTGVSHEQLNVLHRAAGRVCLLLLWVHAWGRHSTGLTGHFDLANGWLRSGVTGLAALTLTFFLSMRPVRKAAFEFFLCGHIVLIAIFIISGFMHASEPGFGIYFWPGLIVWGFDRTARLLKLVILNKFWHGRDRTHASVELLTADTVRLTFRREMSWRPGQHVFLNLPGVSTFPAELHPFTIASTPDEVEGTLKKIVCIIRARQGFTRRLRDHVTKNGATPMTALVDGPYGSPPDLSIFSTAVLIAGGSGITFTLTLLLDLIQRARANTSSVKKILWVWTVRDPAHLRWIGTTLHEACSNMPSSLVLDARVYVSGSIPGVPVLSVAPESDEEVSTPSTVSEDSGKKLEDASIRFGGFTAKQGRPDVYRLLEEEIDAAEGRVSVSVAGPPQLAQAVRGALRFDLSTPTAVLKGKPSVELHTESFGTIRG